MTVTAKRSVVIRTVMVKCPCCGGQEQKAIVRKLGMCVSCAAWRIEKLEEAIRSAAAMADADEMRDRLADTMTTVTIAELAEVYDFRLPQTDTITAMELPK